MFAPEKGGNIQAGVLWTRIAAWSRLVRSCSSQRSLVYEGAFAAAIVYQSVFDELGP